ncbi:hypothetical protein JMJ77_0008505, partial [Colletotrichum scovillei]
MRGMADFGDSRPGADSRVVSVGLRQVDSHSQDSYASSELNTCITALRAFVHHFHSQGLSSRSAL